MAHSDELLDGKVNAKLRPNQPYRIPVNGWTQEMAPRGSRSATNTADRTTPCWWWPADAEPETVKALAAKTYGRVARGPDLPPHNRPVEPDW
ncbi:hypothetical protein [Mesorhizobium sp. M0037]|uniref:hypothetical protein n=1 Tax=unclassified Mesorhizobium TaxID=325217 RepID=UPI00333D6E53